jgi:hypothetical protein
VTGTRLLRGGSKTLPFFAVGVWRKKINHAGANFRDIPADE